MNRDALRVRPRHLDRRRTEPYRGLVLHDEAWHWAMSRIHGEWYPVEHPELAAPCPAYRELD
ncbi:hypothetical protein ABZT02_21770 [Streptomyces sp. NPDC005402]|uniref:hypothetical protein n=1 Tax=Streptomyces sp. NPDC005402 TaxID=3155338 RepID=UPI0033B80A21